MARSLKGGPELQQWLEARRRHRLSDEKIQMLRELGLNPKKLGKIDNHHQEPWKAPLPEFIEHMYRKRFGRERPAVVVRLEDLQAQEGKQRAVGKASKTPGATSPPDLG